MAGSVDDLDVFERAVAFTKPEGRNRREGDNRQMKIQVLSDLHLEHGGAVPPHVPGADVIVLAGDLAPYCEGLVERLRDHWAAAPHILYVLGNHEFYGTEIDEARARLAKECREARFHLLDPGTVQIDGVCFIGATLWTDLALEGPTQTAAAHLLLRRGVSDFMGAIRHRGGYFTTGESVERHRSERAFIERELARARRAGERAVVVTHHAPSPRCIRPWFDGDPFNPAFASNLDRVIKSYQPALWIHGHMHDPVDEWLGDTRLLANPAGYAHENKRGFDPALCVDLEDAEARAR